MIGDAPRQYFGAAQRRACGITGVQIVSAKPEQLLQRVPESPVRDGTVDVQGVESLNACLVDNIQVDRFVGPAETNRKTKVRLCQTVTGFGRRRRALLLICLS